MQSGCAISGGGYEIHISPSCAESCRSQKTSLPLQLSSVKIITELATPCSQSGSTSCGGVCVCVFVPAISCGDAAGLPCGAISWSNSPTVTKSTARHNSSYHTADGHTLNKIYKSFFNPLGLLIIFKYCNFTNTNWSSI